MATWSPEVPLGNKIIWELTKPFTVTLTCATYTRPFFKNGIKFFKQECKEDMYFELEFFKIFCVIDSLYVIFFLSSLNFDSFCVFPKLFFVKPDHPCFVCRYVRLLSCIGFWLLGGLGGVVHFWDLAGILWGSLCFEFHSSFPLESRRWATRGCLQCKNNVILESARLSTFVTVSLSPLYLSFSE